MKGQVSVEMLLVLVIVIAIVLIVANQLIGNAKKASNKVSEQTEDILNKVDEVSKGQPGDYCIEDDDCASNICIENKCE